MSWWIAGAAAVGAMADRKKPLRGAAMGAGLMATGGAAAGAMGGGAAAAGAGGAAAGGAGAAGAGTAAAGAGTAAAGTGAAAGGTSAGGAGLLGGSTAAAGSAAPAAGAAAPSTGLLSSVNAGFQQYQPMINAASTGIQMSGLLDPQQQAAAPEVQQMQGGSQTMAQLAGQDGGAAQMQVGAQDRERRRQAIRGGM